jgi:hypothetical protein
VSLSCTNFLSLPCVIIDCPDGVKFLPKATGSMWEAVPAENGGKQWRLVLCPAGYELTREPSLPETDDCVQCPEGKYRLKPTRWHEGPNVSLASCYACPTGATCPGGDIVAAADGYWQLRTQSSGGYEYLESASDVCQTEGAKEGTVCLFPAGVNLLKAWADRPMRCTRLPQVSNGPVCAREVSTQLTDRPLTASTEDCSTEEGQSCGSARVYRCPERACSAGNACLQNRTGPL